jgi:SAM-dependent methyltransferase
MSRLPRIALVMGLASLLVAGRGRIGRLLRAVDQRAGIFAPRGARLYNAVAPTVLRPLYRRVANDVAALAVNDESPANVLEIGSGPGELAFEIARRLPQAKVLGVDLADAMVARAAERAREAGVHLRVQFRLTDAANLPLADGSFDIAVSTLSLHHWADPGAVFAELGRVLRPGGVALVYDLRPFAYLRHELEVFLAGTPFEGSHLERDLVRLGLLPAAFVRIRVVRPVH